MSLGKIRCVKFVIDFFKIFIDKITSNINIRVLFFEVKIPSVNATDVKLLLIPSLTRFCSRSNFSGIMDLENVVRSGFFYLGSSLFGRFRNSRCSTLENDSITIASISAFAQVTLVCSVSFSAKTGAWQNLLFLDD